MNTQSPDMFYRGYLVKKLLFSYSIQKLGVHVGYANSLDDAKAIIELLA